MSLPSRSPRPPQPPHPRTLIHPGPLTPVRIRRQCADSATHYRLSLQPGQSLYDALIQPLTRLGVHSASVLLLGGAFEAIHYCVGQTDPTGQAACSYADPLCAGRAFLLSANATVGKHQNGQPVVHCHAAFRDEQGRVRGGHLLTEKCIIGPQPLPVRVTALHGFELRVSFDPETNIALLQPQEETRDAPV